MLRWFRHLWFAYVQCWWLKMFARFAECFRADIVVVVAFVPRISVHIFQQMCSISITQYDVSGLECERCQCSEELNNVSSMFYNYIGFCFIRTGIGNVNISLVSTQKRRASVLTYSSWYLQEHTFMCLHATQSECGLMKAACLSSSSRQCTQ